MAVETTRRQVLAVLGASIVTISSPIIASTYPDKLKVAKLGDEFERDGELEGIHGIVALHKGDVLFERYYRGDDYIWGKPLGPIDFNADTLHDIRSVTKSIVGLIYGIALSEGKVPELDQPVIAQFPEYTDLLAEQKRQQITIRDTLTMMMGLEWNEDLPYTTTANSEVAMEAAEDRYRFILARTIVVKSGQRWCYSGGAVALIGKIIERGTGQPLQEYAREKLFTPLGIDNFDWIKGHDGTASAASGLRLTPRALANIRQLILQGGQWNNASIVPKAWLDESFQPVGFPDFGWPGLRYGYLWYVTEHTLSDKTGSFGTRLIAGIGNGGQRLFIFPDLALVLVTTSGKYDQEDQWKAPNALLFRALLPSLLTQ